MQADGTRITHIYTRQSLLKRRAAGEDRSEQLVAANVTTLGIVSTPGVAIMALTLCATVWTSSQGIILTVQLLGFFFALMMLMPHLIEAHQTHFRGWDYRESPATG